MTRTINAAQLVAELGARQDSNSSKYKNKRVPDPDGGPDFDSRKEFRHAGQLKLEQRAGHILGFDRQVRLTIAPEGVRLCVYVADFIVHLRNGRHRIDECKGVWTKDALLKAKAFRLFWLPKNPTYDYRVLGGVRRQEVRR